MYLTAIRKRQLQTRTDHYKSEKRGMEQNADVLKAQVEAQCGKAHVPDILWK